ncbi:MAG: hypothetical protein H6640_16035 [Caldilineaceae bacterium]|nr:hypothetical protein [Caldilineaceae bacterium]
MEISTLYEEQHLLPHIIWVAARPPVPPFSGITSKTLCGLDALLSMTHVDLVTFADESCLEKTVADLHAFWGGRHIGSVQAITLQRETGWLGSLVRRQFQFTTVFDRKALAAKLDQLRWSDPGHLLIFDDIVLAPFAQSYGANAILSPHDCMSEMFRSHAQLLDFSIAKLRKYIQYKIARRYERRFYSAALLVHVISQRDRIWMESINPAARYHVVPNSDLLNPGLVKDDLSPWDTMIWGDLSIAACAQGTREFLSQARQHPRLAGARMILVGKVSRDVALNMIGRECMAQVDYASRLEDNTGQPRSARIMVVPDIGGAGIKNRVVNVVSSGLCLACLLPQMEGVELLADRGAINALDMRELVDRISIALDLGDYARIASTGQALYHAHYSLDSNRRLWRALIERALSVRNTVNGNLRVVA